MGREPKLPVGRGWSATWPWLLLVLGAASAGWGAKVALALDEPWRGHGWSGLTLGLGSATALLFAGAYSARKRGGAERRADAGAPVASWLGAHVFLGLLALVLVALHAGWGVLSPPTSTGVWAWWSLAGLVASGVAWRVAYALLPRWYQPRLLSYGRGTAAQREAAARAQLLALRAGRSELFQAACGLIEQTRKLPVDLGWATEDERLALRRYAVTHAALRRRARRPVELPVATFLLQGWRWLHLPLTALAVVTVGAHVASVGGATATLAGPGTRFESADRCAGCHQSIVEEWRSSMHAHAMTSPVMIAQTNVAVVGLGAAADACVNCHGPTGASLTDSASLPLPALPDSAYDTNAGIDCVTCHQIDPEPHAGVSRPLAGGFRFGLDGFAAAGAFQEWIGGSPAFLGRRFFGISNGATGNRFHRSEPSELLRTPGELCVACHNVHVDRNDDGRIDKQNDLVLQRLAHEWDTQGRSASGRTCIDCHARPFSPTVGTPVVDGPDAHLPYVDAVPDRTTVSHRFVGVDHPIDQPDRGPRRADREALLASAASVEISSPPTWEGTSLRFGVKLTNAAAGHFLPSGFAFARQLWLEVRILDARGRPVFASGVIGDVTDDLCDATTMDGALGRYVVGCTAADPQLVNLQALLVDRVTPVPGTDDGLGDVVQKLGAEGREVPYQVLTGGAIARVRPVDGEVLAAVRPKGSAAWSYATPSLDPGAGPFEVTVRVRFRSLPPYFLRALDAEAAAVGSPGVDEWIGNLEVIDMASVRAEAPPPPTPG